MKTIFFAVLALASFGPLYVIGFLGGWDTKGCPGWADRYIGWIEHGL